MTFAKRGRPKGSRTLRVLPAGCTCVGPFEHRDPKVWTWGRKGSFYEVRGCKFHDTQEGRKV
jgi:hypothetical protein